MHRSALVVTVIPPLGFVLLLIYFRPSYWSAAPIAGLALSLSGLALLTLARMQLGNSFSVTPQARRLVTHGLYSRVRHPVYVFGTMAIAGLFLYLKRPMLLLVLLPLVPLQVLRARAEERVLEDRFGEEYRKYRASTWF